MRQFDVFTNPITALRRMRPYLVLVQSPAIGLRERAVVMPFVTEQIVRDVPRLMPQLVVAGRTLWFAPFDPAVAELRQMGAPIANVDGERDRLLAAIDLVFTGI